MAARVLFTANRSLISRISTTITPSSILPLIPVAASLHQAAPVVNNIRVLQYQNGSLVIYDEARMKIYSVSTRGYYAFGARMSSDDSLKLQAIPSVRRVLPDSYVDVENKDYGGEPFIDGKAVPYDAKYHEEFDRNNAIARAKTMNRNRSLVMSSHSIRSKPSPKKKIWLDGCDFEHWLVVVKKPEGSPTRDEIIDSFINTLAKVVGSYDEATMKIYSVLTRGRYYGFGASVSSDDSLKLRGIPGVLRVLPDSYMDVENKDYGGEPFINGKAAPYHPKYHKPRR